MSIDIVLVSSGPFDRSVLAIEPRNAPAIQLRDKIQLLQGHMKNLEAARQRKDWGMVRLALDRCLQSVERGEGEEIPTDWRTLRVELELARGNWDAASIAAKSVLSSHFTSPLNIFFPLSPATLCD